LPGEGGPDGVVLRDAHRPAGIPDTLVQGSLIGNQLGIVWRRGSTTPGPAAS
jgi:proline iminopeptidase